MPKYNENNSDLIENAEDLIAKKNNARRDIVAWLLEYVEILVFSLAFVVVLFTFFVEFLIFDLETKQFAICFVFVPTKPARFTFVVSIFRFALEFVM